MLISIIYVQYDKNTPSFEIQIFLNTQTFEHNKTYIILLITHCSNVWHCRLQTLGGMQASDELTDAQVRQMLFDLESAYNAFNRVLHNAWGLSFSPITYRELKQNRYRHHINSREKNLQLTFEWCNNGYHFPSIEQVSRYCYICGRLFISWFLVLM